MSMRRTYKRKRIDDLDFYKKFCEANKAASGSEAGESEAPKVQDVTLPTCPQGKLISGTSSSCENDVRSSNPELLEKQTETSLKQSECAPSSVQYSLDIPPPLVPSFDYDSQKDIATVIRESRQREEEWIKAFKQRCAMEGKVDPINMFRLREEHKKETLSMPNVGTSNPGSEHGSLLKAESCSKTAETVEQNMPMVASITKVPPLQAITAKQLRPVLANNSEPQLKAETQKKLLTPSFPHNVQIIARAPTVLQQITNVPRNALLLIKKPSTSTTAYYPQRTPTFVAVRPQNRPLRTPYPIQGQHFQNLVQPGLLNVPLTGNKLPAPVSLDRNFSSLLERNTVHQMPSTSKGSILATDTLPLEILQVPLISAASAAEIQTEDPPNSLLIKSRFKAAVLLAQKKQNLGDDYEDCTDFLNDILTKILKDFIAKCIETSRTRQKLITPEVQAKLKFLHDVEIAQAEKKKRESDVSRKAKEHTKSENDEGGALGKKDDGIVLDPLKENRIKLANEVAMAALGKQKSKPAPNLQKVYITTEDIKETLRSMKSLRGSMFMERVNTLY